MTHLKKQWCHWALENWAKRHGQGFQELSDLAIQTFLYTLSGANTLCPEGLQFLLMPSSSPSEIVYVIKCFRYY